MVKSVRAAAAVAAAPRSASHREAGPLYRNETKLLMQKTGLEFRKSF